MTKFEYCIECNEPTYNAGKSNGSLYLDNTGPYCDACYYGNLYEGYRRLKAENQRLREALEWIQDHKEDRDDWWVEQVLDHVETVLQQEGDQKQKLTL